MNQKGFSLVIIILVTVGLVTLAGSAYYFGKLSTPKSSVVPPITPLATPDASLADLNGYPVYTEAKFIKKEKQPACVGEVSGFSVCNTTTYTWQTKDDYDQVSSWYREDKSNSGWKCSGGAGSYDGPRSSMGKTTCRKGDLVYDLSFSADATNTEIVLQIPYKSITQDEPASWKMYTAQACKECKTFSFLYPPIYQISDEYMPSGLGKVLVDSKGAYIDHYPLSKEELVRINYLGVNTMIGIYSAFEQTAISSDRSGNYEISLLDFPEKGQGQKFLYETKEDVLKKTTEFKKILQSITVN